MFWKIKARIDRLISQLTYRQKFIFLAVVFILSSYTPAYWLFSTIGITYSQNELKNKGLHYISEINFLAIDIARFIINTQTKEDKGEELEKAITLKIKRLAESISQFKEIEKVNLVTNKTLIATYKTHFDDVIKTWEALSQSSNDTDQIVLLKKIFFILQKEIYAINVAFDVSLREDSASYTLLMGLRAPVLQNTKRLTLLFLQQSLSSPDTLLIQSEAVILKSSLMTLYDNIQIAIRYKHDTDTLQSDALTSINAALSNARIFLQTLGDQNNAAIALQTLQAFSEYVQASEAYVRNNLNAEQTGLNYYWWALVALICFGTFHALFYSIFRVLSRHILTLRDYVKRIMDGYFDIKLTINPKDSIGKIGVAICTMGNTLGQFVSQLKTIGVELAEFTPKVSDAMDKQQQAIIFQENKIYELEKINTELEHNTDHLNQTMNDLLQLTSKGSLEKGRGVGEIQLDMQDLVKSSLEILTLLEGLKLESLEAIQLLNQISKISDEAHVLSLNASIEILGTGEQQRNFTRIKHNIQLFAQTTASSTEEIWTIINDMTVHANQAHDTTRKCLSKINTALHRFVLASREVEIITEQGWKQDRKFQDISRLMTNHLNSIRRSIAALAHVREETNSNRTFMHSLMQTLNEFEIRLENYYSIMNRFTTKT